MTTDDEIDEDALSFGYVPADQLHRVRVTDDRHTCFVDILPNTPDGKSKTDLPDAVIGTYTTPSGIRATLADNLTWRCRDEFFRRWLLLQWPLRATRSPRAI